jgi:ABC-type polar amino acid transport system ATPase subunit
MQRRAQSDDANRYASDGFFAREFADCVCFFSQGKIIEQGPSQHERTQQFVRTVRERFKAPGVKA